MNEYPTENDLQFIVDWNPEHIPLSALIEHIGSIWWMLDWGFHTKRKKNVTILELHTGGWSGNESIVVALRSNLYFWNRYWWKSIRGGHYYFEIPNNE